MSAATSPTGTAPVAAPVAVVEFVSGGDLTALSRLVSDAVTRLVGEAEASLVVTELREEDYGSPDGSFSVQPVVEAAQTPPMLSSHRVVVARQLGIFGEARALDPLIDYLSEPLPTTRLLLVWEKGATQSQLRPAPAALRGAVEAAGGVCHRAEVGRGRAGRAWLTEQLATAQVVLDRAATDLLAEHLGEDRARVWAILDVLAGAYGPGSRLGTAEVAPFLGARGTVPPWELTDAIGKGDIAGALSCLQRLSGPEGMHPLQVLAILRNHVDRMRPEPAMRRLRPRCCARRACCAREAPRFPPARPWRPPAGWARTASERPSPCWRPPTWIFGAGRRSTPRQSSRFSSPASAR
ncbi:MAG: hypothetical protein J4F99_07640 [Acidimicrobiia bacterium]|nr:hypothetical protein [Acidimicrobiia bacterium]